MPDYKICASIKTSYWDKKAKLAIEKLFDVNVAEVSAAKNRTIWQVGRFVISNKLTESRIGIFKLMLFDAFYSIYRSGNGILFAECNKKLTLTLVPSFILRGSIEYICSETLPIYIKSNWLKPFIYSNSNRYFSENNQQDFLFF